jgi:thiamine-monophosphate kinase
VTRSGLALGPGGEFDRIRRFLGDLSPAPGVAVGPGDDAAVLADGTVLSTDLSVEGIHFRLDWISPEEAGGRAVVAALSDLAAMAAAPLGVLVSLGVARDSPDPERFMAGVRERIDEMEIPLLGGDLTRTPGPVVLDVAVVGRVSSPLLRSGARPGDQLWVTGTLGGAAAALAWWEAGTIPPEPLRHRFARPRARIREVRWLRERCPLTGGLDLSDGLAGDAAHLAAASGVAVHLLAPAIPVHALAEGPGGAGGFPPASSSGAPGLERALHGGEDYELLLAAPPGEVEPWVDEFRTHFDLSLTRIGKVRPGRGVWIVHGEEEAPVRLERGGWDHFGSDAPGGVVGARTRDGEEG